MGWQVLGTCVGLPPIFLTKLVKVWQTRVVTAMLAWEIVTLTDQGRSKITWIVRCSSKVATVEGSIGKWPIWGNCKWYRATLWKAPSLVCPWNWGLAQTKQQGYRLELHRVPTRTVPQHWGWKMLLVRDEPGKPGEDGVDGGSINDHLLASAQALLTPAYHLPVWKNSSRSKESLLD